ncbi:tRNA N(3)-methylcytidine methyltransferase trm141-like isoform X2 [Primulina tabacum]|uniref:tRNA N(3)-methylcytidine methyltransferase trm141-like isoform X2 n=1 Tax=Primulina tabacum TaxID=48773 RepID=UPI003F59BD9C
MQKKRLATLSFLSWSPGISRCFPNACIVPIYFFQRGFYEDYEHHFSRKSLKYWDKFFSQRDRHYLEKDWGKYFLEDNDGGAGDGRGVFAGGKVLLEVGCGAGNTIFPLIATYPKLFVYACDFSSDALALVKVYSLSLAYLLPVIQKELAS